jgi:hypothetical protein
MCSKKNKDKSKGGNLIMFMAQLEQFTTKFMEAHRDEKMSVRLSLNIIGGAGKGKTEMVEAQATKLDMAVVAPRAGELEGGEFTGIPRDEKVGNVTVMKYALPGYLPHYCLDENEEPEVWYDDEGVERKRINIKLLGAAVKNRKALEKKHGKGWEEKVKGVVIFLDEVNRAQDDQTKMSIFQLPEKYAIHTYEVPDHCVVLAAMNPSTDEYQVNEMDQEKAFMNRFIHVRAESRTQDWLLWADRNDIDSAITSYINADPSALSDAEESFDINVPLTPRSWGKVVSTLLKDLDLRSFDDGVVREVLSGVVGTIHANNFVNHMKENMDKVVSGEEILKDYKKVQRKVTDAVKNNRMDYLDQVTRNLYVILAEEDNIEKYKVEDNIGNIELFLGDLPPEVRMTFVQQLVQFDHVNELLGASDVVFEILNADATKAHSSN